MTDLPSSLLKLTPREAYAYEQMFQLADNDKTGIITAERGGAFFAKSELPSTVLSEIWEIADELKQGRLDEVQFYVAFKLIALVQNGKQAKVELLGQGIDVYA
jgi:epidermal growth factor receptor substrate 15